MVQHEVIVGNYGFVYSGISGDVAARAYTAYVRYSLQSNGCLSGQWVTWRKDGITHKEHSGLFDMVED